MEIIFAPIFVVVLTWVLFLIFREAWPGVAAGTIFICAAIAAVFLVWAIASGVSADGFDNVRL